MFCREEGSGTASNGGQSALYKVTVMNVLIADEDPPFHAKTRHNTIRTKEPEEEKCFSNATRTRYEEGKCFFQWNDHQQT